MYIARSPALVALRERLGDANRELLTVLVALEALRGGGTPTSTTMRMSWSDEAARESAVREARRFVFDAALGRTVDAFDAYLGSLRRWPSFRAAVRALSSPERSVKARLEALAEELGLDQTTECALTQLAIQWRNRRLHWGASNRLDQQYVAALRAGDDELRQRYAGVTSTSLLAHFGESRSPRLREIAALSRGMQTLGAAIDRAVVLAADPAGYASDALSDALRDTRKGAGEPGPLESLWRHPPEKRERKLAELLRSAGFKDASLTEHQRALAAEWLAEIATTSQRELAARLGLLDDRAAGRD